MSRPHSQVHEGFNEQSLQALLEKSIGRPLTVIYTDNATSMISVREKKGCLSVRLHRMFLDADTAVLAELTEFIRKKSGKIPAIRAFIKERKHQLKKPTPRNRAITPRGKYYNLGEIFETLNSHYFNNSLSALITWGKRGSRYAVRRRTLGTYDPKSNSIRINPVLDNSAIPLFFIEFIVYHEMLHIVIAVEAAGKRRRIHSKEFKTREQMYKHYHKALAWEKQQLQR